MDQLSSTYGSAQPGYAPTLMDAFEFDAGDLAANRNGMITDKQLTRVKTTRSKWQLQLLQVIGLVVAIIAIVVLFTPYGESLREVAAQNPTIAAAGIGGSLAFYLIILAVYFIRTRGATNSGVSSTTGQFKLVGKPVQALDGKFYQRIRIDRQNFFLTTEQANLLTAGTNYRVYFTGGSQMGQILSVEQV
jgi:hypothetical protein